MRALAQPRVIKSAAVAAAGTTLACLPRMALWPTRLYPLWYVTLLMLLGAIVLWAFVLAWFTQYTERPVFILNQPVKDMVVASGAALAFALLLYFFLDPQLIRRTPTDYPRTVEQWAVMALFDLAFVQLFLIFAPFAWAIRLVHRKSIAVLLTVAFGVFVMLLKVSASPVPVTTELLVWLICARVAIGFIWVGLFLRGGVVLVWWCGYLIQLRHLVRLALQ